MPLPKCRLLAGDILGDLQSITRDIGPVVVITLTVPVILFQLLISAIHVSSVMLEDKTFETQKLKLQHQYDGIQGYNMLK